MLVRTPEGHAVFICSRGERPRCDFPAEPVPLQRGQSAHACPTCGQLVDTYESEDGRTLAYRHAR